MTGEELERAYGGVQPVALFEFANPTPEELEAFSTMWRAMGGRVRVPELRLEPPTGVPVAMHEELRGLHNVVEATAAELATIRELLELLVAALGVEVVAEWSRPPEGRP